MNEKIIYKWGPLSFKPSFIKGRIIHTGLQDGDIYVWTEQEIADNITYLERIVKLVGTGQNYIGDYYGTVIMPSNLVWHVVGE